MRIPSTSSPGLFLQSLGDGQDGSVWGAVSWLDSHTFSVSGTLAVPSGAANYLPPFAYPLGINQTATLSSVVCFVRAGSCTLSINQNGAGVAGLTGISVTTALTQTSLATPVTVSSLDTFAPVLTAVTGADGLTVVFIFAVSL